MIKVMAEEWIVRVEGKDYGPADLETLREWKGEGRLLPTNPVRRLDGDSWTRAAEIDGLFEATAPPIQREHAASAAESVSSNEHPAAAQPRSLGSILAETVAIYRAGFFPFLGLTVLTVLPSLFGQFTARFINATPNVDVDLRTLVAALFSLCMFGLTLALWPIYIAGIQVLSSEIASGRRIGFFATLNQAVRFWPRVAALCLFVYGVFALLLLFGLFIAGFAALIGPSLAGVVLAFGLLVLQTWMFGRFFINVLFWQQTAVFEGRGVVDSLRASQALARSGRSLPWYRRPLWRGAFIASLWFAFVLAIAFAQEWPYLRQYFSDLMTTQDPQVLWQKMAAAQQAHGLDAAAIALRLMQRIFQPLLGIAFVVLYLDSKRDFEG